MLEKLTPEQVALIPVMRERWITRALGGDNSFDKDRIHKGIDFVYALSGLKEPQFKIIVQSPWAIQYAANILPIIFKAFGEKSGDQVGAQVRAQVWAQVGAQVGDQKLKWFNYDYNGYGADAGWISFYEFFKQIRILKNEKFDKYVDFVSAGAWDCVSFQDVAIVCTRPTKVIRDARGFLHNTKGAAVEWGDGYKNYFCHGARLEAWMIEAPEKITAELALKEANSEVRRAIIEIMGLDKFLHQANPKILDKDKDAVGMPRQLMQIDLKEDEPLVAVEVNCPSTNHKYFLRVPPKIKTCSEAVAWTFGYEAKDYLPLVEA